MSIKSFFPDTAKEYAQIGMAISRLGTAMSAVLLFAASPSWVVASLILTWLGSEISQYFKLDEKGDSILDREASASSSDSKTEP